MFTFCLVLEPPLEEGPVVTAETEQQLLEEEMRRSVTEMPEEHHFAEQRVPPRLMEVRNLVFSLLSLI